MDVTIINHPKDWITISLLTFFEHKKKISFYRESTKITLYKGIKKIFQVLIINLLVFSTINNINNVEIILS